MVNEVFTKINKVIYEYHCSDVESAGDNSSSESCKHVEECKEDVGEDLSLRLINKEIGATSEFASSQNYSEEVQC